jgi:hypothetical protein
MKWISIIGRIIARQPFVRGAIEENADLSAFKQAPSWMVLIGVSSICLSFVICWPAIGLLGFLSLQCRMPLLIALGGPALYGLSHLLFIAGMGLSGAKYSRILLRWLVRICFKSFTIANPGPIRKLQ